MFVFKIDLLTENQLVRTVFVVRGNDNLEGIIRLNLEVKAGVI
jgi:hypothetical protein